MYYFPNFCRKLRNKLEFYRDSTDVVAKLPLSKQFPKYFDSKSQPWKRKLMGRLDLEMLYLDFVSTVRDALFDLTTDCGRSINERHYNCEDGKIRLDFEVCQRPQCAEEVSTQVIRR